jgi:Nucleotide modification associated domain 3
MTPVPKNIVLLRVGIDRGAGGMAGPLFDDGSFEFIPIDADSHAHGLTYGNAIGINKKKPLIRYFPESRQRAMRDRPIHNDPEFRTWTYGDPTMPKQGLRDLEPGDFLVLYSGLRGWNGCKAPEALYIVGYFVVEVAGTYPRLVESYRKKGGEKWVSKTFSENQHIIHGEVAGNRYKRKSRTTGKVTWVKSELVLVKGGSGSRLLKKAVRLSAPHKRKDKGGHNVFVLDPAMARHFGRFTALNAIQRSIPRWVDEQHIKAASTFLQSLH